MVFCRILRYFVIFVIYAVLSRNMFLAIHALLRGDKFNKKLCPWRKNDKYEVCLHIPYFWDILSPSMFGVPDYLIQWIGFLKTFDLEQKAT